MRKINLKRNPWLKPLLALLLGAGPALTSAAPEPVLRTEANVMVELSFTANLTYGDPFNEVTLDVIFMEPQGRELRVPAFWAGTNLWKARYASPVVGTHRFRSECSDARDGGLHGITGQVEVKPYTGPNPLYAHGPLHVSPNRRYLEHRDGTPFFWLGDTWWMGLCHRLRWPEEFQQLAADRKAKGFNVIQIVAGLYPDMAAFDPRGANEAGFPWETNYARIRPEYFDGADARLRYLVDQGFTPCIVGAWGYFLPWMGVDKMKLHWRYLIARYGSWPVVWCVAGEANLPWYLAPGFPYDDRQQVHGWTEVTRFVRDTDPFRRPVTIHPTAIKRYTSRHATDEPLLLDFDMLQTPHGQSEAVPVTVKAVRESYAATPMMPVINGEATYEMLLDRLPTRWTRTMFWLCLMNGAAGHTYGANGIWQCNRSDQPHGASPHGGNYGKIPWNEAMHLPGSQQIGFGKKLLEQYPWHRFRPHPEWAVYTGESLMSWDGCQWIWYPEGNPAQNAPAEKRFFRRTFVLPEGKAIKRGRLQASADDWFAAQLNGTALGIGDDWHTGRQFENLARRLRAGTNVLAIVAENKPAGGSNPAALIASLEIQFDDGQSLKLVSDNAWRCATKEVRGWDTAGFDDAAWPKVLVVGRFGDAPWGPIGLLGDEDLSGPQAAGIPGVVRVIYVPQKESIGVRNLGAHTAYAAAYFDPIGGQKTSLADVRADAAGLWTCPPPSGQEHDWVLILENKGDAPASDRKTSAAEPGTARWLTLANKQITWHIDWSDGRLQSSSFENRLSGQRFILSGVRELALNFSAVPDRVAQPFARAAEFEVKSARMIDAGHAVFELSTTALAIDCALHVQLDGPTRRKWVEVANRTGSDLLLLDVELDDFATDGATAGGGQGKPVFIDEQIFAAIEHPAGVNQGEKGRIQLAHFPGHRLAPGAVFRSHVALVSAAPSNEALDHFVSYIQSKSLRPKKAISVYTPFGINNQWGACPTLDDEQTLDVLGVLEKWQKRGARLDFFTLDTGWVDFDSDLTRFRCVCYPNGPQKMIRRVNELGMKFGLWFAVSWATQSCWEYPPAYPEGHPPGLPYREGYPITVGGISFCFGYPPYSQMLKKAVLHHVQVNKARFLKFDGGSYYCENPNHGHLPGKYSVEPMFASLIDIANSARAIAPDVFVMWYWGLGSPFWALHGDSIFESGLHMEGSGTSPFPTLYYRDSVTLAQDQNAQFAKTIPPIVKDSLGVWLADSRWGNFMGKERWREALVMDLGRGNLLFPNLWGNVYYLDDQDVDFLARMAALARQNETLFLHRRNILGDPFRNEVYGYAHCQRGRGFLFLNNVHFAARRAELPLDGRLGLDAPPGTALGVVAHFPEQKRLRRPDGTPFKAGDTLDIWLRPFEVLMLEITPVANEAAAWPVRSLSRPQAADLGAVLELKPAALDGRMQVRFADAAQFERQNLKKKVYAFESSLPSLEGDQPILAVALRLRRGDAEWRHSPTVVQIVQTIAQVGQTKVQLIPVPDGRQYGNTQKAGCSWVVYKVRLNPQWSHQGLKLAIHAYIPEGVEAQVEAWVVKRWWEENTRPASDGYYTDAPS